MKKNYEKYELEHLMGDLQDPELDYYLVLKQKLSTVGVDFIINLNDVVLNPQMTMMEILKKYFHYITQTGKNTPKYIRLRGNLEKIFLYDDEEYFMTINFEDQVIFSGQFNELTWRAFENKIFLDKIKNWSLLNKLNLKYGYLRVHLKLSNHFGITRSAHEEENKILDTEYYIKKIFYNYLIKGLDYRIKDSNRYGYQKTHLQEILKERAKLWEVAIDWNDKESIPFNSFGATTVQEYFEMISLFFDLRYNYKLLEKSKQESHEYNKKMNESYRCLRDSQPIFLQHRGYNPKISWWTKGMLWIKILKG